MPEKNKRQNSPDYEEGQFPRKEGSEYETGRQEALEEAGEKRVMGEKEAVEERLRADELRGGHAHTPYFEYDSPSYEDKEIFSSGSPGDKKEHKRKR